MIMTAHHMWKELI